MLRKLMSRLGPRRGDITDDHRPDAETQARIAAFAGEISAIEASPYLMVADARLRLISVFDDLKYDRSDMDMMSGPMRRHLASRLAPLGFTQKSGSILEDKARDMRLHIPKFRALGASPFDATLDTQRRAQDYFALTPTQAACQIIMAYPVDEAVERVKHLIGRHPANLLRISDYIEQGEAHRDFHHAIGHLRYVQRMAVESDPLKTRRALR